MGRTTSRLANNAIYTFVPPLKTRCMPITTGKLSWKPFSKGVYLARNGAWDTFKGDPDGETIEHLFYVERSGNGYVRSVLPDHLTVVK